MTTAEIHTKLNECRAIVLEKIKMEYNNGLLSSETNFHISSTKFKNRTYRTAKLFNSYPHLPSNNSMTDLRQ